MSAQERAFIGTSGWAYPEWKGGVFYPARLAQAKWLAHYATRFGSVEVNGTFYALPRAEVMERWERAAPEGFVFALKLWRGITHYKRLKGGDEQIADFLSAAKRLGAKRGPLLVQLPEAFARDDERLDDFLRRLREAGGADRGVAVEFRHASWGCGDVASLLDAHGAALCVSDWKTCRVEAPNGAGPVYIRRHGPASDYRGAYARDELEREADRIAAWLAAGRDVHAYFNNTMGAAASDAAALGALIGERRRTAPGPRAAISSAAARGSGCPRRPE